MLAGAFLMHIGIDKREGKQILHTVDAIDAIGAIEQDGDGSLIAVFHLEHHLSAGAARGDWLAEQSVLVFGGYGKLHDGLFGALRLSGKDG